MLKSKQPGYRADIEKKSRDKIYYPRIGILVRRDSGIYEAVVEAISKDRMSVPQYMLLATREKLIRDGYMPTPDDEGEPSV